MSVCLCLSVCLCVCISVCVYFCLCVFLFVCVFCFVLREMFLVICCCFFPTLVIERSLFLLVYADLCYSYIWISARVCAWVSVRPSVEGVCAGAECLETDVA